MHFNNGSSSIKFILFVLLLLVLYSVLAYTQSSCSFADSNTDNIIDISELMQFIASWKAGNATLSELMSAISEWKYGCVSNILWQADHETGDLTQYVTSPNTRGGSFDTDCLRPNTDSADPKNEQSVLGRGVSQEFARSGIYSMKMTALIDQAKPACRQFRYLESSEDQSFTSHERNNPLYYSFWMYLPDFYEFNSWTNIVQFKTKTYPKDRTDAFWVLELRNRLNSTSDNTMYFMLRYKGLYPGPNQGGDNVTQHFYHSNIDHTLPANKWFNMQIYLKQSTNSPGDESNYDGQIVVWQDGIELYNMNNVATRYPDSWNSFSVNSYTATNSVLVNNIISNLVIFVDDMKISDEFIIE